MNHIQLLDKTKTAFIHHQNNGKRYYPATLKNDAVSLLKYYSAQELSKQLGISSACFTRWHKEQHSTSSETPAFFPLTLNEEVVKSSSSFRGAVVVKLPHQLELILSAPSIKETTQFIACLLKEIATCSI